LTNHLHDVATLHAELTGQGKAFGHVLGCEHGAGHAFFKEAQFGALGDAVAHGEFDHVVAALECYHVVVNAGPWNLWVVFKVKLFRLEVGLGQGPGSERDTSRRGREGQIGKNVLFLLFGEVPEDDDTVGKDKHLAKLHGVGSDARVLARVAAVRCETVEGCLLVRVHVVAMDKVRLLVAKVALVVVALLVALNLLVEHRLAARALERRTTSHAIAVTAREKRQVVDGVEAVVVELGAGIVLGFDEFGGALHFVGLGGAVGRDARKLVRPPRLGQPLCIALVLWSALGCSSCKHLVCGGSAVLVFVEFALLVVVLIAVCFGQEHKLLAELAGPRWHMRRYQAASELGVERMAAAGGARVVDRAGATRRAAALLRRNVRGVLQDVVD
jgi:hypothetical protein